MAERLLILSEEFRSDVHHRLMSENVLQALAAAQLITFVNGMEFEDEAFYGGRLQGSGDDHAEIRFSPWGEGYFGVPPMRVWYVRYGDFLCVIALCPEKQSENPEFSKFPELGTIANRAKSVLEKNGIAGASNWYLVDG